MLRSKLLFVLSSDVVCARPGRFHGLDQHRLMCADLVRGPEPLDTPAATSVARSRLSLGRAGGKEKEPRLTQEMLKPKLEPKWQPTCVCTYRAILFMHSACMMCDDER